MNDSSPNRNNVMSELASQRADDVSAGRQQIDARRETIQRYNANALAETEALALARIKADTERALAHQTQVLRDAERAAELAAIERRSADLDAIKVAQRRQTLDVEAAAAAAARSAADKLTEQTALEKKSALAAAQESHLARLAAERDALVARRNSRLARARLAWLGLRCTSPILAGLIALLIGTGAGWLIAEWRGNSQHFAAIDVTPLKLDTELSAPPRTFGR